MVVLDNNVTHYCPNMHISVFSFAVQTSIARVCFFVFLVVIVVVMLFEQVKMFWAGYDGAASSWLNAGRQCSPYTGMALGIGGGLWFENSCDWWSLLSPLGFLCLSFALHVGLVRIEIILGLYTIWPFSLVDIMQRALGNLVPQFSALEASAPRH